MPLYPQKPCQEPTCPYAILYGVVEDRSVLMGFLSRHNQIANCLRRIISSYRPQKACWKPKIWLCDTIQYLFFYRLSLLSLLVPGQALLHCHHLSLAQLLPHRLLSLPSSSSTLHPTGPAALLAMERTGLQEQVRVRSCWHQLSYAIKTKQKKQTLSLL